MKDILQDIFIKTLMLAVLLGVTGQASHAQTQESETVLPQAGVSETLPQIEWVGDIPIMPGLIIEPGLGFAFDSPEGRIVTIYLSGEASLGQIETYYRQALEPLGWQSIGTMHWRRDRERLAFESLNVGGLQLWKITIRP